MSYQPPMIAVLAAQISRTPRTWGELLTATGADREQLDLLLSRMERRGEAIRTHLGWATPVLPKPFVLREIGKPKTDGKLRCPGCYKRRELASFADHKNCHLCRKKATAAYHRNKAKRSAS